jgi:hypothetical protein
MGKKSKKLRLSQEERERRRRCCIEINKRKRGKPLSAEHRRKISLANTGKKRSQETRERMSKAQKGRTIGTATRVVVGARYRGKKLSLVHRANISAGQIGRRHSRETRAKMSVAAQGHGVSPETREKLRKAATGPRNANWRGGLSRQPYSWAFNNRLKEDIRQRDGKRCQLCGAPQLEFSRSLCVHHIDYNKSNNDPVNLITLCPGCNVRANRNRNHWMALFQEMMIQHHLRCLKEKKSE